MTEYRDFDVTEVNGYININLGDIDTDSITKIEKLYDQRITPLARDCKVRVWYEVTA